MILGATRKMYVFVWAPELTLPVEIIGHIVMLKRLVFTKTTKGESGSSFRKPLITWFLSTLFNSWVCSASCSFPPLSLSVCVRVFFFCKTSVKIGCFGLAPLASVNSVYLALWCVFRCLIKLLVLNRVLSFPPLSNTHLNLPAQITFQTGRKKGDTWVKVCAQTC